jgi:glycosyltransferase involved in cell wall biosynthesis
LVEQDSFRVRPRIAHITNHGYGGVTVPTGGAPDTGGQNVYVNAVVRAMVELGYHVTVFARGGFPFFESTTLRQGIEPYGPHARYVYVPGGGNEFIRKEDIAVAVDEEVEWLLNFIDGEAGELSCEPWEVYEIVNSHYWDAGVMGMSLEERWRSRRAGALVRRLLEGTLAPRAKAELARLEQRSSLAQNVVHHTGQLLYLSTDDADAVSDRTANAVASWCHHHAPDHGAEARDGAKESLKQRRARLSPAMAPLVAADVIGETVWSLWQGLDVAEELDAVSRHVFTPHSLAVLKEENYRDKPEEVRRALKFCERRHHERTVCRRTRAFAATSTEIAEHLRTDLDVDQERIFFYPPCIDRKLFRHYSAADHDRCYAYLEEITGVSAERWRQATLVFETSRMDRTKRKDVLLEAFAQVADQSPDALLVIGGGPDNEVFRELQAQREANPILKERAFLTGFLPDELMYPLFDLADIFVSASEMEGFGMSISQAAALGVPIVASHLIPFAVQYVPDDALIVRAGDVTGFAEAMKQLLQDPDQRKRRGERLARLTTVLDWGVQAKAFLDHLHQRGLHVRQPGRTS